MTKQSLWEDVDFNIRANTAYKLAYASEPKVYIIKFSKSNN
jgi:hypothetical protein